MTEDTTTASPEPQDGFSGPLRTALDSWRQKGLPPLDALTVSGSGLAVDLGKPVFGPVPLQEVLPFPVHAVIGHPLEVVVLEPVPGRHVLYQRGRLHSYQGYSANETVFMVRLAALLGAGLLLMTNASGGLRRRQSPGDLVLVTDHLNLIGMNPLRGEPPAEWGPRFPDMTHAYDLDLRASIQAKAAELGISLGEGVYGALAGPNYETPAEVRMLRALGADLVGMSTALEVIAARHMDVRCGVISLVTNAAAGVAEDPLGHQEVLDEGKAAAADVRRLLGAVLRDPRSYQA